jgi:hypothetical protein
MNSNTLKGDTEKPYFLSLRGLTLSTRGNPAFCGIASLAFAMTS